MILLAFAAITHAATNDLTGLLQKGLFEEEANRNLDAAISNYQSLANAFDKDRQVAATATFRLGECYRKLGRTNEAAAQYQRIIREFGDQQTLVALSQQNLAGLGTAANNSYSTPQGESATLGNLRSQYALLKSQLEQARKETNSAIVLDLFSDNKDLAERLRLDLSMVVPNESMLRDAKSRGPEAVADASRILRQFRDQIDADRQQIFDFQEIRLKSLESAIKEQETREGLTPQNTQSTIISDTVQQLQNALVKEEADHAQKSATLKTLKTLKLEELRKALPTVAPDDRLNTLMSELDLAEQKFLQLKSDFGPNSPKYQAAKEQVDALQQKVDDRISGIMAGLQAQLDASQAHRQWLEDEIQKAAASNAAQSANEQAPVTNEEEKEIRRIQDLIKNSPDLINATTDGPDHNETPLYQAASEGWLRAATYLLDHGADINIGSRQQESPLYAATGSGNRAMVELLLSRGADVNATSFDGTRNTRQTCLHLAVEKGFLVVAATLLDHKADVNARDGQGQTPLHRAARNGRAETIKTLLAHGADINAKDEEGATPLSDAVLSRSLEAVNVILAAKPQLDLIDKTGRTPLAIAAGNGYVDMVKALLAAKADPNAGSKNLPLIGAVISGSNQTNITALLLRAGADPNKVAPVQFGGGPVSERNAIQIAVTYKEAGIVKLLLDYGGDAKTNYGPGNTTLLHRAALNVDLETSRALLAKGADANTVDALGNTSLHFAIGLQDLDDWNANSNRLELVKVLLENHANPNVQNKDGKTPLDLLKIKIGQNAFRSYSPDKIRDQKAFARELADLLRANGALDNLPNWSGIEITRPSIGFSDVVFRKGTNNANQFSLLELLAVQYQFLTGDPGGGSRNHGNERLLAVNDTRPGALPFPDLTHVHIRRPDSNGKNWMEQTVDMEQLLESDNCSNNAPLHWGDRVEIPETDHPLNEGWHGFSQNALNTFQTCLSRQIQVVVKGESHNLKLQPDIALGTGDVTVNRPFWILPVLRESNLLLTSSDLSHIKVTRRDATTGKTHEWTVDCSNPQSPPSFWLRDGDVIEVPEKPGE